MRCERAFVGAVPLAVVRALGAVTLSSVLAAAPAARAEGATAATSGGALLADLGADPDPGPGADGDGDGTGRADGDERPVVEVRIESPEPGRTVENDVHLAPIRGRARAGDDAWKVFDVMVVLDVSYSTRNPSGIDVDGDGEIGFDPSNELVAPGTWDEDTVCTDPDDTILAAEVHAARRLLEELDPTQTRVGVIAFSGESDPKTGRRLRHDQRDAWIEEPLTSDFAAVEGALVRIRAAGPQYATNFAAAIRLSVTELVGLSGARSAVREDAKRVVLFLTDGEPSFPYGHAAVSDPEDTEAAISAARLAHKAGVTINTYALGKQALSKPVAATEMARLTAGLYTPVRNPGDIVQFLQGISFANVDDVVITNLTLREVSYDVSLAPDGSFTGFVPVRIGPNEVQVTALASDGSEATSTVAFDFQEAGLTERELARELERIKARNKELLKLLERERIQRFRERQRDVIIAPADEVDAREDDQP